jgi:CheY-like chemotaxis protein
MLPSEPPCSRICVRRPRILIVDDDPGVIRSLCRILRQNRPDFLVTSAVGTVRALEALSKQGYDVVITDLQMPGGGGRAVLAKLIELYPETARIIHSSQPESSDTLSLAKSAHVVLAKPACESEIGAAIELALALVASPRSSARSGQELKRAT